jgi:hypothetical protein
MRIGGMGGESEIQQHTVQEGETLTMLPGFMASRLKRF